MDGFLLHNGALVRTNELVISPGQVGFMNGWGVFSTIRVSEGVLFAFQLHYQRMKRDAERLHIPFPFSEKELEAELWRLIEKNQAYEATLRVALVRNRGGIFEGAGIQRDCDLIAFTADLKPWGSGVKLSYQANGRFGACPFAGVKTTSWVQNLVWNEAARERGFDELLLLNERGEISECTSANVFAVFGTDVFTPPLKTSGCLPGITRHLLLEQVLLPDVRVNERVLTPADLAQSDQVFITSTTRDLLPVNEIDASSLHQNGSVLLRLREAFQAYQREYVALRVRRQEAMLA